MEALVAKINEEFKAFQENATAQLEKGNKAAGTRARKAALELSKLMKEFRKASLEAIANKLGELGGNYDNSTVFICHGDCIEDAKYVENILKTKYGVKEVLINYTGAVIGSHSGPGTMAVFFLGDHR